MLIMKTVKWALVQTASVLLKLLNWQAVFKMSARKHLPKLTLPIQKVEGTESLYRDALLGIATSCTNQYHGYYYRKYFDIL